MFMVLGHSFFNRKHIFNNVDRNWIYGSSRNEKMVYSRTCTLDNRNNRTMFSVFHS